MLVVKYQVRHWQLHEKYCQIKQLVMKIFTLFSVFNALEIYVCLRTTTSNLNKHFWRRGGNFWGTLNVKELVLKKPMVHVVHLVDVPVQEAEFKKNKHIKKSINIFFPLGLDSRFTTSLVVIICKIKVKPAYKSCDPL